MVHKIFLPGERVLIQLKQSPLAYLNHYIIFIILAAVSVAVFLLTHLGIWIKLVIPCCAFVYIIIVELIRKAHTYYITSRRTIYTYTLFSKKISSMFYERITDSKMKQSFIERILSIGRIELNAGDSEVIELRINGVRRPEKVLRLIEHKIQTTCKSRHHARR